MSRDVTARTRILRYLETNGPIEDESGQATAHLRSAVGYQSTPVGFIQLLKAMVQDGELERRVRGKRTYAIGLPGTLTRTTLRGQSAVGVPAQPDINYDQLAHALLREVAAVLRDPGKSTDSAAGESAVVELETEIARVRAERDAVLVERAQLRLQLDAATKSLETLATRLAGLGARAGAEDWALSPEDGTVLKRLLDRELPKASSGKVSA